ncbi:MAG: YaiI/YqxD family protein, partial [Lentisphaeraceae bacterium]|nr:YaiI/YqxD family protein [Lentisphaeraceae bacterium]
MKVYIDADACPREAKEALYKATERLKIDLILVANQYIQTPNQQHISCLVVPAGPDIADDKIVELCEAGDLVITSDIPLADRIVKKGALGLDSRGKVFDERNIANRLATRDLLDELRGSGIDTGGPPPYSQRDRQTFINSLDRLLTK